MGAIAQALPSPPRYDQLGSTCIAFTHLALIYDGRTTPPFRHAPGIVAEE